MIGIEEEIDTNEDTRKEIRLRRKGHVEKVKFESF